MNLRVGLILLIVWCLISCNAYAYTDVDDLYITVDGIDYPVDLHTSRFVKDITINGDALENKPYNDVELYQGTVIDVPGSWVAASFHDGEWQGLASVYDKLYELKGAGLSGRALSIVGDNSTVSMEANEMELTGDFDMANMCAMPHTDELQTSTALASVVSRATVDNSAGQNNVAFAVGGITQAVNIVIALDQFHTAQHGNNSVPRAMRILNSVDAIYRNSLGVALNNTAIVSYNNANPIFGNETNADTLLGQLRATQANIFGNSPRTLGSVLTARNIQVPLVGAGVAGIAYVNSTCSSFAVSVNEDRASEGIASVILAHEMGHNFGASHDPGNAACPTSRFIMSSVVSGGLTEFSSCSKTDIANHIALGSCYQQPIDIALSRFGASTPNNLAVEQNISRQIAVSNNGSTAVSNIRIDGNIDNVSIARFNQATVNGQACTILDAGKTYRCSIGSIAVGSQQIITETIQTVALGTFTLSASFDSSNVSQRIDILPGNQTVRDSREVNQVEDVPNVPNAPSGFSATAQDTGDINLAWTDNSDNEQSFRVQRARNGGALAIIANLAANTTSYADRYTNLEAGTAYRYRVIAVNADGTTPSNQASATALARNVPANSPAPVAPNNDPAPEDPANDPAPAAPNNDPAPDAPTNNQADGDASSGGGGGGGAIYLLTILLLFARVIKSFK